MNLQEHVNLQAFNTLNCAVQARYFLEVDSIDSLREGIAFAQKNALPLLVLGGGSNVVLACDFEGLVLNVALRGITVERLQNGQLLVSAGAGEHWDSFVEFCLEKHAFGLENLSLIPGLVGAAPTQNIGAYGVEIANFIDNVEVVHLADGRVANLSPEECNFAYRDSVFKRELANKVVITRVVFRFPNADDYQCNTSYAALKHYLADKQVALSPQNLRAAVIDIRTQKLPDTKQIPNVGSFFKNPVISVSAFHKLEARYPELPSYPDDTGFVKIPAAWLIDNLGWKGYRDNEKKVGVHSEQALVLVNYHPNQNGMAILELAEKLRQAVKDHYDISLEIEPKVIRTVN